MFNKMIGPVFLEILSYLVCTVLFILGVLFIVSSKFRYVCYVWTILSLFLYVMMMLFPSILGSTVYNIINLEWSLFFCLWPYSLIGVAVWMGYLVYDMCIKDKK